MNQELGNGKQFHYVPFICYMSLAIMKVKVEVEVKVHKWKWK